MKNLKTECEDQAQHMAECLESYRHDIPPDTDVDKLCFGLYGIALAQLVLAINDCQRLERELSGGAVDTPTS